MQTPSTEPEVVLEVENIVKRFPGILANAYVNLTLRRGEILALLGENGAGKSTLMNIIYGLYHADEGTIRVKGKPVYFASPREAIHSGIGMVHQHFQLIPVMTVAENVVLGAEETIAGKTEKVAPEDTKLAGLLRLLWGVIWRISIPLVAVALGLLVAQVAMLLGLALAPYLVSSEIQAYIAQADRFNRWSVYQRATTALGLYYPGHESSVTVTLWLPALIGCAVAAAFIFLAVRHARKTWRGTKLVIEHLSPIDSIMDALIDLAATTSLIQNRQRAAQRVRDLSQQFGLEVDPDALVGDLPVGLQQRVEIVKALYRHADILILDEPTAVLTPQESRELFRIMKDLAAQGVSIIFITHKLKEVFAVADSIVVMRGGKVVGTTKPQEATESSLAAMMVGREVILRVSKTDAKPGDVVLSVSNLHAKTDRGAVAIDDVSFDVRSGEVFGIAGVQGNGQTELVEVLTGLRHATAGQVRVLDKPITHANPREITVIGTAHIPEDRQRHGMVKPFSVADNLILNQYYNAPFSTKPSWRELPFALIAYMLVFGGLAFLGWQLWSNLISPELTRSLTLGEVDGSKNPAPYVIALLLTLIALVIWAVLSHFVTTILLTRLTVLIRNRVAGKSEGGLTIDDQAVKSNARQLIKEFDIRTPAIRAHGGNLSGGNQQKMIVAREFSRHPQLLIASQPTRGIDVGSIEFIHQRIIQQRDTGAAVVLVSAELDEIMALSDRIAVMYKGRIMDIVNARTATREQLGLLMAGIIAESSVATVPAGI